MLYDSLNKYPFTLFMYQPKYLTHEYHLTKVVLTEVGNFASIKKEGQVPNIVSPKTLLDWWHYLIDFAENNPKISFASDIFSWSIFRKHFKPKLIKYHDCLLMILDPLKTGKITFDTIHFKSHIILKMFSLTAVPKSPSELKLPPFVVFREEYPHFRAFIVNKDGSIKMVGNYTNPDAAHRARVQAQVNALDLWIKNIDDLDETLGLTKDLLRNLRNHVVRHLTLSLDTVYPVDPKVMLKLLKRRKTIKPESVTEESAIAAMNETATKIVIDDVNAKLRLGAKHHRHDIDVIGEGFATEHTRKFLEERSWLNRKQLRIQRGLQVEAEAEAEAEVEIITEIFEEVTAKTILPKKRIKQPKPEFPDLEKLRAEDPHIGRGCPRVLRYD